MANISQDNKRLAKFLMYVLGRHPDEFGLLPDEQGFVKIKALLQALHEDPEWRHIRQGQLSGLVLMEPAAPVQIQGSLIRALDRDELPRPHFPDQWPKLLYTPVRQRAYAVVLDKGIRPGEQGINILSDDVQMAQRLGRRLDNAPVVITVQVQAAQQAGVQLRQYGTKLFLADDIPTGTFTGPPLPKERPADAPKPKTENKPLKPQTPGSYFPDLGSSDQPGLAPHQRPQRDEKRWKKSRRQARKEKVRRGWQID